MGSRGPVMPAKTETPQLSHNAEVPS